MQNPEPASLFNGGKSADGSTEAHIAAFLERMDRLTAAVERSAAGAYQRRLTMSDIGNPAPIGLYAFAIATALYMSSQALIVEASGKFLAFPIGIFLGGATMVIAGFFELLRKNGLAATAFAVYGSFWLAVGTFGIIRAAGIFFLDSPKAEEALTALMGMTSLVFCVVSLAINVVQPFLFINLAIMFFLLSGGVKHPTTGRVAGWWGLWASGLAFYVGSATLLRDTWQREVLPQGYTKAYLEAEKKILPRMELHAPRPADAPQTAGMHNV